MDALAQQHLANRVLLVFLRQGAHPDIPLLSGMAESDVLSSGDGISRLLHEEEERLKAVRLFRQPLIYVQT